MDNKPKLWKDMTPEEKGALLLAKYEKKFIECYEDGSWNVVVGTGNVFYHGTAYRVKPEPKREKITARICLTKDGASLHMEAEYGYDLYSKAHLYALVTFDIIDGKPDPESIKIEEV
jgi:hypothetical protein